MTKRSALSQSLAVLGLIAACLLLVLALAPGWQWAADLSTAPGIAHAVAFPNVFGVGLAIVALCSLLAVGAVAKQKPAKARGTLLLPTAAAMALMLAGIFFVVPATRGSLAPHTTTASPELTATNDAAVTIASWNTHDEPVAEQLAQLISAQHPDVIVLPETEVLSPSELPTTQPGSARADLSSDGTNLRDYQAFQSTNGRSTPTSVLVHRRLGNYHEIDGPVTAIGSVTLVPDAQGAASRPMPPTILAIHPIPPLPGLTSEWRSDIDRVVSWGEAQEGPLVIAGDFNATKRHGSLTQLSTLQDASAGGSFITRGTWPRALPVYVGAPIDHILVKGSNPSSVATERCELIGLNASDHRAIVAQVVF